MSLFAAFSRLSLVLAAMAAPAAELRHCSEKRSSTLGTPVWAHDGRGNWSASTTAREAGTATLRCRIELPEPATNLMLSINRALVSFIPSASKDGGAGLTITAAGLTVDFTRTAGEDWIEAGPKSWPVQLSAPARRIDVVFTLHDPSRNVPVRIDLSGITVVSVAGSSPDRSPR